MPRPVAILLAAGEGRRVGGPKALLGWRGETFLSHLAAIFTGAGCDVLAVLGARAADVRAAHLTIAAVENAGWQQGQFSSVRCGLEAALRTPAPSVLIHPVDIPRIDAALVRQLLGSLAAAPCAVPSRAGETGHPVAMTREAAARVLASRAATLESALRAETVFRVETDSAGPFEDVDTPADYRSALAASR